MKILSGRRVKELMTERNRLEADRDELEEEATRLRKCIANVKSMATTAHRLGHEIDPEHLLFLVKRDLEDWS